MEQAPYVSLANKYRPQTFEDMVGQESISKTLLLVCHIWIHNVNISSAKECAKVHIF